MKVKWQKVVLLSGFCAGSIALSHRANCQAPTVPSSQIAAQESNFLLPGILHGYVRQDSGGRINPAHALRYRAAADSANSLVVSISQVKLDSAAVTTVMLLNPVLQTQVKYYLDSLRIGIASGAYRAFKIAYRNAIDTTIQSVFIPGYTLAVAVQRPGETVLRFAYWYVIQGWLLQARATMPTTRMATSTLPLFVRDLVGEVARDARTGRT